MLIEPKEVYGDAIDALFFQCLRSSGLESWSEYPRCLSLYKHRLNKSKPKLTPIESYTLFMRILYKYGVENWSGYRSATEMFTRYMKMLHDPENPT